MKELEKKELMGVDGGLAPVVAGIIIAAVAGIIKDWDDFKEGFFGAF